MRTRIRALPSAISTCCAPAARCDTASSWRRSDSMPPIRLSGRRASASSAALSTNWKGLGDRRTFEERQNIDRDRNHSAALCAIFPDRHHPATGGYRHLLFLAPGLSDRPARRQWRGADWASVRESFPDLLPVGLAGAAAVRGRFDG